MIEYFCAINHEIAHPSLREFKQIKGDNYFLGVRGKFKFENDCIFEENSRALVMLVGVVFNKNVLVRKGENESWFHTIIYLYLQKGDTFFTELNGSFNLILFDKLKRRWLISSNIQSERPIFYFSKGDSLMLASNINLIQCEFTIRNRKLTLSMDGAYMILSHGYMLSGYTLFNEIKRIRSDYYGVFEKDTWVENKYHCFDNVNCTREREEDIIEHLDTLFLEAVKLQFEKDLEYAYKHVATLSGGLDSRMTVCCAHELGYTDQLNVTFSQSNYHDAVIPSQIASRLKHNWIFKSLDNGIFLFDLDNCTRITGGNVLYSAVAHGYSIISHLDFTSFGLLHTGQIGHQESLYTQHSKPSISDGAYSNRLTGKISKNIVDFREYPNVEIFETYNKDFNGFNYGLIGILPFTETFSPHYNLPFLEYCLKIPPKLRYKRYIYKKWVVKKHPLAAGFVYEKTGVKLIPNLRDKLRIYRDGKAITLEEAFGALYRCGARKLNLPHRPSLKGMNPYEAWYMINDGLRSYFNDYFRDNIPFLENYPELKSDCVDLFNTGTVLEKIQVLSLLSSVKIYIEGME